MVPKLGTLNCVVQITFCCVLAGGAGKGVCVRGVGGGGRGPRPEPVWAPWGNPENSVLAAKEQGGLRN